MPPSDEESIFYAAMQTEGTAARSDYLADACSGDILLRRRVERLLAAHEAGEFLEHPAAKLYAPDFLRPVDEPLGSVIGPYKLLEQIGEGGMGLVYMAEQTRPLRRLVALKVIKPGLDTRSVIARFEAERQALALMDHPNIAKVFDAGATDSGRPYFVMELVRGEPITEYCAARRLDLRQRLELFMDVCHSVQHAHRKGIIHRDLKPSNILVSQTDANATPKVIDFGVAKAIARPLTEHTLFTSFVQIIGTPLYMSPEQADLANQDVDTRSDVYSLGVVLYEMLTGVTPFDAALLRQAGPEEIRRILREDEPPKPSTRATTLAVQTTLATPAKRQPATEAQISEGNLKGELDWIVMKALEKDRTRRYDSASAFAADVQRYLDSDPVEAGPPSALYRLGKAVKKRRVAFATTALVALSLVAGAAISGWQAFEAIRARKIAEQGTLAAQEAQRRAEGNLRRGNEAVEMLLSRFAEEPLLDQPHMEDFRKSLMNDALRLNSAMLEDNPQNSEAKFEAAKSYRRMAQILGHLGDSQTSVEAASKGVRLLEELMVNRPSDNRYLRELAQCRQAISLGYFNGVPSTPEESLCSHRRSIELFEKLATSTPDDPDLKFRLSCALTQLGFFIGPHDLHEAIELNKRGLALAVELMRKFPDKLEYAEHVARVHWFLGRSYQRMRKYDKANDELQVAISASAIALDKSPQSAGLRKTHAEILCSMAANERSLGRSVTGRRYAIKAEIIAQDLVTDYPTSDAYPFLLDVARKELYALSTSLPGFGGSKKTKRIMNMPTRIPPGDAE